MPSLVSWLVAGLAVADRAASLSYTLSKTYDASNFLDEFEFQTSAIDLPPGFLAPSMNYQNKADALNQGLVSVQNGKIYLGVDSKKPSGWGERPTIRVLSKNSFNQGLVITKFTHLPEPVCGGSPFFGTRGTGEYPSIGMNMYEGWDLHPIKKVGLFAPGLGGCVEDQYNQEPFSGGDCKIRNKIWGSPKGGIQALEWTSDAIKLYDWPINAAPSNIESSNPDTSSWGTPSAQFIKPSCDTEKIFSNQTLEFSLDFCDETFWSSDYADGKYGPTCSVITGQKICHGHVTNKPQAFKNYYFEVENIRIFQEMEKTQGQLLLDPNSPSFTFNYTTSQPSSDNWIGVWPEDDTQAPIWGSITWDYVKENSGTIQIPPPSSAKAGNVNNNVDIKPGNGVCINTDCGVSSLEIPSVGSCPDGQVRISYWQNADCAGDWYGYGYGSRGTCRGLWSNGWGFKSLWLSCAEPDSDCINLGTCTAAPEPSTEVCRAAADAGTTDAFHLKTRYSTGCTGDVHNEVTVPHGNGQCIDTNCAVGSLDIDNVGNCPDGELRISYWEQSGCSGKWFGYGYGSRNTCRTLWSSGSSFKSLTKPGVRPLSRKRDKPLRTYGKRSTATPEPRSEPPAKRARTACTVLDDKNIKPLGFIVPEDHVPTVVSFFKAKPQSTAEQGQAKQSLSKPELIPSAKRSILNYFRPTAHLMPIEPGKANNLPGAGPVEEQTDRPVARPKRRLLRIRLNQSLDCDDEIDQEQIHNRKSEKDESKDVMEGKLQKRSKRGLGGGSGLA
ncbi:hypothetical protein ARSEF4850_009503, partial [Beauveria asiatica]